MSEQATGASAAAPQPSAGRRSAWRPVRLLLWLGVLLVVSVAVLVAVVATFDWNRARPWIGERVSKSLQRPFAIEGELSVQWLRAQQGDGSRSWLPWPHVFAHSVVLGNPEWSKNPQMIKVDELAFVLSPLPLLVSTLHVPAMRLSGMSIAIERLADGRNNWTFAAAGAAAPAWNVKLGDLVLDEGRIVVEDAIEDASITIEVTPLGAPVGFDEILRKEEEAVRSESAQTVGENAARKFRDAAETSQNERRRERRSNRAYEYAWTAKGKFRGVAVDGRGRSGGILDLQDTEDPFPVQVRMRAGTTRIAFVGTLTNPADLDALDLRLWVSGKSMADLYPLTRLALPDTPPFVTEGHLSGELERGASIFLYEKFTGRVGGSDLGGTLTWTEHEPRPKLTGSVKSELLQFVDLAPLVGANQPRSEESAVQGASTGTPDAERVIPNAKFRTERWNAMDADVAFSAARIVHAKDWPIDGLATQIVLDNGHLRLDPLRFGIAGGRVRSAIGLDGSKDPLLGRIDLEARELELGQLLPITSGQATFGQINASVALVGTGNSVAGVLGSSDGTVNLLVDDGAISKALLETAGLNIGNVVITRMLGDREVKIDCAAAHFVATDGDLDATAFIVDTDDALVDVTGHVDLGNERLDLTVRPQAKGVRVISLRSPLYVTGTFRNPDIGVKKGPLLARGAGAVLLAVFAAPAAALIPLIAPSRRGDPNRCEALLAQMRGEAKAK